MIYRGTVYDNNDPDSRGRLRALVPQRLGDQPTGWALPVLYGDSSTTAVPEIGQPVWVSFEGGDVNYPVWLGTWPTVGNELVATDTTVAPQTIVRLVGQDGKLDAVPTSTDTGESLSALGLSDMHAGVGMMFFFSALASDHTMAIANLPATGGQVALTGKGMSASFWNPEIESFYTVPIPTDTGQYYAPALSDPTAGGGDTSDVVNMVIDDVEYFFFLSAINDWHWENRTYWGNYPRIAAFRRQVERAYSPWEFDASMSIYDADLLTNSGFTFKLPAEMEKTPHSNCLVVADYGLVEPARSGRLVVLDPTTKSVRATYQWPDLNGDYDTSGGGGGTGFVPVRMSPRDLSVDPTSTLGDERIGVIPDLTRMRDEKWVVKVFTTDPGSSPTFKLTFNAGGLQTTAALAYNASAAEVQAALEALSNLDPGHIHVRKTQPFLVDTYGEFYIDFLGAKERTNVLAVVGIGALTGNWETNYPSATKIHDGVSGDPDDPDTSYGERAPFFFQELTFDANNDTLDVTCAPILPTSSDRVPNHGELYGDHFGFARYDQNGNLWLSTAGVYTETQFFYEKDYEIFVKSGGERSYVTDAPPGAGWEDDIFANYPTPSWQFLARTTGAGSYFKGLAEDSVSGTIFADLSNGVVHAFQPIGSLIAGLTHLPNPDFDTDSTGWSGTNGTLSWAGGEVTLTATGIDAKLTTGTGLSGIPFDSSAAERPLFATARVKQTSGATYREAQLYIGCYDDTGTILDSLLGYGPKVTLTANYQTIVADRVVPDGTAYVAVYAVAVSSTAAQTFVFDSITLESPPISLPDDMEIDYTDLEKDFSSFGTTKGVVDPVTRKFLYPLYQQTSSAAIARLRDVPQFIGEIDIDSWLGISTNAVVDASYVTLSLSSALGNGRVLDAGTAIEIVDSGPGGTVTIGAILDTDPELAADSDTEIASQKATRAYADAARAEAEALAMMMMGA